MEYREAINILKTWRVTGDKEHEALNMAISALQAQEAPDINVGDVISSQESIDTNGLDEEIRCEMCKNPMRTDRGCDGNCKYDEILYEKIIQILNKRITPLSSAQPEQQWIPVSERLPKIDEAVLVTTDWDDLSIAWRTTGVDEWYIHEGNTNSTIDDITAWMPLPEPYRAERRTDG